MSAVSGIYGKEDSKVTIAEPHSIPIFSRYSLYVNERVFEVPMYICYKAFLSRLLLLGSIWNFLLISFTPELHAMPSSVHLLVSTTYLPVIFPSFIKSYTFCRSLNPTVLYGALIFPSRKNCIASAVF